MKTSRIKFVIFFIIGAIVFLFVTTSLLDQPVESLIASPSQVKWQSTVSNILSPVKIILMGPLLPFIKFLRQDPDIPPPFFLAGFGYYWIILALTFHYLHSKVFIRKKA